MFARHEEHTGTVAAAPQQLFERLDDHSRLSAHMSKRSWKMGWGRMETVLDPGRGQVIGSHIILRGRVFGIRLYLDEVVTSRQVPHRKVWETVGEPRLLVIGRYSMGFEIRPEDAGSRLRVFIEYDLPATGIARLLGRWFGRAYAQWCTRQMVVEAQRTFAH